MQLCTLKMKFKSSLDVHARKNEVLRFKISVFLSQKDSVIYLYLLLKQTNEL